MTSHDLPPLEMIPGRRILVVDDLGPVHKGDHVVIVANVVVAVDTSRRPEDVRMPDQKPTVHAYPEPVQRRQSLPQINAAKRKKHGRHGITDDQVMTVLRQHAPLSAVKISDHLGLERHDAGSRGKVSRILKALIEKGIIDRISEDGVRMYRYDLITKAGSTA